MSEQTSPVSLCGLEPEVTPIRATRVAAVDAKLVAKHGHDPAGLAAAIRHHPVRNEPTARSSLERALQRVHEVSVLARSVLDKYPQGTIPDTLGWARVDRRSMVRLEAGRVALRYMNAWTRREVAGEFPVHLLDAQDSEVTAWVRERYRKHQRKVAAEAAASRRAERDALAKPVADLKRKLEAAERDLAHATAVPKPSPSS